MNPGNVTGELPNGGTLNDKAWVKPREVWGRGEPAREQEKPEASSMRIGAANRDVTGWGQNNKG